MDVGLALFSGFVYWLSSCKVGYTLESSLGSGLFIGFMFGLFFGDMITGLALGASIQLVYLGMISTGGNMPADNALAAVIAIPIAMKSGLDANAAVALAVPFGVLGVFLDQLRRTSNSIWVRKADELAQKGDIKGIFKCAYIYPEIVIFFLRFVPVFLISLLGTDSVISLIESLPAFIITGFSVAGGILPAMGFAIILITIGKPKLLPYFFIGFFAVQYLGLNNMATAIFGTCLALLVIFEKSKKEA
ncbi:PTS mannose/fructose/sorbose/N-acetylgalactosamine transporter subunit IIC [Faecalicoccus acidiformans]|uniref:PTS mannose/fructose/sorbose/N-acetylgalactosamine transporter subunit IIC n=1 Tax=Faecalicoccus acidiformans TaxID=915173 RepID=UPI001F891374|nr:PTS sugar transporter subunit IIC [Candidatus Faecalicoccus intestinipullorum]